MSLLQTVYLNKQLSIRSLFKSLVRNRQFIGDIFKIMQIVKTP